VVEQGGPNPSGLDVISIEADKDGCVWFGTQDNGLWVYEGCWSSYRVEDGLPSNAIETIEAGNGAKIWIGTPMGAATLRLQTDASNDLQKRRPFPATAVLAILSATDGTTWIGTRGGAARYAATGWVVHRAPFDAQRFPVRIEKSSEGDLWASTLGGFHTLREGRWDKVVSFERSGNSGADDVLNALMADLSTFRGSASQLDDVTAVAIQWWPADLT